MNNLKPLVWDSQNYTKSALHQYLVRKDDEATKNSKSQYVVAYGRINTQQSFDVATGFSTIDDAKQWAWNHYNEKMQPYVKPSPTWIYASDQLPVSDSSYLCAIVDKGFINYRIMMFWTVVDKFAFDHEKVLAWMRLPEPPISKESDCE